MNIAAIIGVSKYLGTNNNLPGCKNDAEAINNILIKTQKFDRILYINENETSAQIKELLSNFISSHKDGPIDEFFFYYSGHGEFLNEEFYYILSDFNSKKRNQTSLQNSELDDLIRTLSPNMLIKVIDACQSGTTYIKDINILNKYFNESKQTFKKCYFLNSSLNTQYSYQDNNLSAFTRSFIDSLKVHSSKEIRYKDIIDAISDEFLDNQEQTPFFVIQAEYTEKFCALTRELREYLNSLNIEGKFNSDKGTLSIADLVRKDAKEYVDKEGALNALFLVQDTFKKIQLDKEIRELFSCEIDFRLDYASVPQMFVIARWLRENKSEYFAKPFYKTVIEEDGSGGFYEDQVIAGFDLSIDTPFKAISIEINSHYPNIFSYHCTVVFILSKRYIRFFYFITNYLTDGWDKRNLNLKDIKWITDEHKISKDDEIQEAVYQIQKNIESRIDIDIQNKFGLATTPATVQNNTENVNLN